MPPHERFAPVWMAIAPRCGTVALNEPPETVNLTPIQPTSCNKVHRYSRGSAALPIRQRTLDHVAVRPIRQGRHERRGPRRVFIIDSDETERTCIPNVNGCVPPHVIQLDSPRPNAILCEAGATQLVIGAVPTVFRNPTIPAISCQRCWQMYPLPWLQLPEPPFGGPASPLEKL